MGQLGRRQAVLFSLIVHLMIVSALANRTRTDEVVRPRPEASPTPRPRLVFIPPPGAIPAPVRPVAPAPPPTTLAQARPRPPIPPIEIPRPEGPPPTTAPTPPPDKLKDRISIGTPDGERQNVFSPDRQGPTGPSRDGRPGAASPDPTQAQAASDAVTGANPQKVERGTGPLAAPQDRSIAGSIRRLEQRRLSDLAPTGDGGAVQQMGPLAFDPEGADFTAWINHWRNEVYRNWIVPQAVIFGFRSGHVDFEFTVERDGSLSALRMLKSSGVRALDRAAENALRGSRFMPLPGDYRPPRVTIQVTFIYNENPQGS